jgi:hypothetical protein
VVAPLAGRAVVAEARRERDPVELADRAFTEIALSVDGRRILRAFAAEEHGQMGSVSLAFTVGSV